MSYLEDLTKDLYDYKPPLTRENDFDEFWSETISQTKAVHLNPERIRYDFPINSVDVYEISYNGFDDTKIYGWLILPAAKSSEKLPCLIHYHGFSGDRGHPSDFLAWAMMGVAVISVDCREQGGKTGNSAKYSYSTAMNVMCKGIYDKREYYLRQMYMDALKAIDFACEQPEIDSSKIILEGGSQGGGLVMAMCALDSRPILGMADVPTYSNLQVRVENSTGSFSSVFDYLKHYPERVESTFENLSYFDTMNMAENIKCPVYVSVGLKDPVCPALQYFATYNRIMSPKQIEFYPFNGHEGGSILHHEKKMRYLKSFLNNLR